LNANDLKTIHLPDKSTDLKLLSDRTWENLNVDNIH